MGKSVRMTLSSEIVDVLAELAERNDTDVFTEIRRAIAGRKFLTEKVAEGYNIYLEDEQQPNVKTRVILST